MRAQRAPAAPGPEPTLGSRGRGLIADPDGAGPACGGGRGSGSAVVAGGAGVVFTADAVTADAGSAGGGVGGVGGVAGESAQPMPATANSAAPTAGSHSGVTGSGGGGG